VSRSQPAAPPCPQVGMICYLPASRKYQPSDVPTKLAQAGGSQMGPPEPLPEPMEATQDGCNDYQTGSSGKSDCQHELAGGAGLALSPS
jgi:hypothetical protein